MNYLCLMQYIAHISYIPIYLMPFTRPSGTKGSKVSVEYHMRQPSGYSVNLKGDAGWSAFPH